EVDAPLENGLRRVGDGGDVFFCRAYLDAQTGEGEERFEAVVFEVFGKRLYLAQEAGFGDADMAEVGQGELAEQKIPVRMTGPLHVEVGAEIEPRREGLSHQFVHDDAIIEKW